MNTIRIYLTESGRIADLQKDFPLYQGQFQNKLLNVFVPTSILAPMFTSSGAVSADYVASTSTKIGMTYTARDGSIKTSKNYYMRYLKTLMYKGVEYALYERKLPKEFTFYAGQGENSPVLIINVVNIEQQSGDTPPLVLSVITSQTCHLDVMQSTFLDRDELDEPSELENLNAQVQALNALMPKKQDKEDENIALEQAPAEKTVVGAINELGGLVKTAQSSADTAQQTAETAQTTADNATTLANNAVATANGAVATANEAKTTAQTAETNANSAVDTANAANATADEAKAIAQGSQRAIGFATLQAAITALNGYSNTQLKVGDNVYIVETGVPDLWVAAVEQNSVAYNYTTNDAFNDDLVENTLVQVGYYKFAYLESDGKPCTVAWQNMTVAASDWVASTEFADFAYEAKIALSDFVNFSSIPQVVFGLTEATSGNYAPICKAGDKGVYIYSKVNTAITLPTVVTFAPNVHGASMQGGGYTNKGKWVASTTYAIDDLVYTDNGQFVCIEGITSTTSPEQDTQHWQATFVATGKTKNGLKISGQDNGTQVQKTFDGSTAVEIAFDETTMTAKEVNGVLKVGAKGTIPEALPQEASALKSGNLPTSGWGVSASLWTGSEVMPYDKPKRIGNIGKTWATSQEQLADVPDGWQATIDGDLYTNKTAKLYRADPSLGIEFTPVGYKVVIIYKNGDIYIWNTQPTGGTVTQIGCSRLAKQTYTISDTSITANSDVLMELTDDGGTKANALANGSIQVIRDTVPTQAIPYTYKVKQTNASGQFTLVNHFVPSISESPTSLPVTYKKASGELPTSGWSTLDEGWLQNTLPASRNWQSVTYGNGKYVAVASGTSGGTSAGAYSTDGITWTEMILPASRDWRSVIYGDDRFVAVAYGSGKGAYSTDGITWTEMSMPAGANWVDVTYGNGKFVAITQNNAYAAYSTNGITWMNTTLPTGVDFSSVTYGNGKFVAVASSSGGKGAYSTDGVSWTSMTMPASSAWYSVTYGDGKFVAVADGSTGAYSSDGISWTSMTLPASRTWKGVTYGNGKFVAVSNTTYGAYSTDGINWTDFTLPTSRDWRSVTYGNGKFIAVASSSDKGAYWKAAAQVTYSISDTDITANTSVKMYLTDEGGVKAQSKAVGSITVIRDEVPTTAIPYEYEVEQTSAEGLFEVINAYVPAVPTKTSQLTNDSGFAKTTEANTWTGVQTFSNADGIKTDRVHNLDNNDAWYNFDGSNNRFGSPSRPTIIRTSEARPRAQVPSGETTVTKEIALLEDIPSAGAWVDVTGETATLTQAGTYQVIASVNDMQSIVYWDGSTVAYGTKSTAPSVSTSGGTAYLFINCAYPQIDASGTLSVHLLTAGNSSGAWTETDTVQSGFKYRKIN